MNILEASFLGVLQGVTEFLPMSSSGHLVLGQHIFGLREPQLFFDVAVHVGTLVAVIIVFRKDILGILKECLSIFGNRTIANSSLSDAEPEDYLRLTKMVLLGTIPTALIGLIFRDTIEYLFASPKAVGLGLLATGLLLLCTRQPRGLQTNTKKPGLVDAILVGFAQGVAIIPGVSRSGSTISTGLLRGLKPEMAYRFSFLLSIPAIVAALGLEVVKSAGNYPQWQVLAVGCISACLVGWIALRALLALVGQGKLFWFAPYCFSVGTLAIILL